MKGIQQKSYGEVRGSFEAQVDEKLGKPNQQAVNGLKEFFESHGLKYDSKIHDAQRHVLASIGVSSKINKVLGGSKFTRPIAALLGFGMGMLSFAVLANIFLGEGLTWKTITSLTLATTLVLIQVFWK